MIHAVLGTGPSSEKAIVEALKDALSDGDEMAMPWVWPIPDSLSYVYKYALDHEVPFTLFYSDDAAKPPTKSFREAGSCVVQKTRDPFGACLKACDDSVLFLWDDETAENDIQKIFAGSESAVVLELSNGLAPIVLTEEAPPSSELAPEEEDEEDTSILSKEELEMMTAHAVKRYGERRGCEATTKTGIIEELFGAEVESAPVSTSESDIYKIIHLYKDGTWAEA